MKGQPRLRLVATAEAARRKGNFVQSATAFARLVADATRSGDVQALCWGLWGRATNLRNLGRYEESEAIYTTALGFALSNRNTLCEHWCMAGLAEIERMNGNLVPALVAHESLARAFERDNDSRGLAWALSGLAQIHVNLGDRRTAWDLFEQAEGHALMVGDHISRGYALRGKAEVALRAEDLGAGAKLAGLAMGAFKVRGYSIGEAPAHMGRKKDIVHPRNTWALHTLQNEASGENPTSIS